jgi:hypothetical protein
MKDIRDWDEEYILASLPIGEFDWFEAKGSKVIKPEAKEVDRELLSKAISAFVNSGGGILVLGIKQLGKGWQIDEEGIPTQIGRTSTKEWLEDIIPNLVELPLRTFNVYEAKKSAENSIAPPGRAIFIIEIGESDAAPHQAIDKIYYGRVGGKSRPLGHRFVMDILGRRRDPIIGMDFAYVLDTKLGVYFLEILMKNTGRVYANYVNSFISIPEFLVLEPNNQLGFEQSEQVDGVYYATFIKNNTVRDPVQLGIELPEFGPARHEPILPGMRFSSRIGLSSDFQTQFNFVRDSKILWKVFADNAPPRSGSNLAKLVNFRKD